jgi:hypothetical protein
MSACYLLKDIRPIAKSWLSEFAKRLYGLIGVVDSYDSI